MKTARFVCCLILITSAFSFTEKRENTDCLQISGIATQGGSLVEETTVKLFLGSKEIALMKTDKKNKGFRFVLKRNTYYALEISKPGFVPRLVIISTALPQNITAVKQLFSFEFEVEIFPETSELNRDFLDFPVAIIAYDHAKKVFDYKKKYTSHIKNKISKPEEATPVAKK